MTVRATATNYVNYQQVQFEFSVEVHTNERMIARSESITQNRGSPSCEVVVPGEPLYRYRPHIRKNTTITTKASDVVAPSTTTIPRGLLESGGLVDTLLEDIVRSFGERDNNQQENIDQHEKLPIMRCDAGGYNERTAGTSFECYTDLQRLHVLYHVREQQILHAPQC
jgi:hypothetical protein